MKKIFGLLIVVLSLFLFSCGKNEKTDIVSTCFAGYDFARAVAGDKMSASMLLNPGEDLHDYSPSIADNERIYSSKLFIYIGGESDEVWVEQSILPNIDKNKTAVINMMDVVKNGGLAYDEEDPESAVPEEEEEALEELDEHVWNSITNAKLIVNAIAEVLVKIDNDNKQTYNYNRNSYIEKLINIDNDIKYLINNFGKKPLIFADKFPLLYFVKEYNLEYDAAFKGCDASNKVNPATTESLIRKIKENNIKIIFVIEFTEIDLADSIINELKKENIIVEKRTFYTMHNVSKEDFDNGLTYIDFMNRNIVVLKEALV